MSADNDPIEDKTSTAASGAPPTLSLVRTPSLINDSENAILCKTIRPRRPLLGPPSPHDQFKRFYARMRYRLAWNVGHGCPPLVQESLITARPRGSGPRYAELTLTPLGLKIMQSRMGNPYYIAPSVLHHLHNELHRFRNEPKRHRQIIEYIRRIRLAVNRQTMDDREDEMFRARHT